MAQPEQIVLSGCKARLTGGDGGDLELDLLKFIDLVLNNSISGFCAYPQPKNSLLWNVKAGRWNFVILELDPCLRRLTWIDNESPHPYGMEATYSPRKLATPYVVLKVPFLDGVIQPRAELFYRTKPVQHIDDELYWANLLNVSPHAYDCIAWICTQYLSRTKVEPTVSGGLHALLLHLWGAGFNRSSEYHEGKSAFSKAQEDKIDPRVTDVDRWEAASVADPRFVLDVEWEPVGMTIRHLIQGEINRHNVARDFGQTRGLAELFVTNDGGSRRRRKGA